MQLQLPPVQFILYSLLLSSYRRIKSIPQKISISNSNIEKKTSNSKRYLLIRHVLHEFVDHNCYCSARLARTLLLRAGPSNHPSLGRPTHDGLSAFPQRWHRWCFCRCALKERQVSFRYPQDAQGPAQRAKGSVMTISSRLSHEH